MLGAGAVSLSLRKIDEEWFPNGMPEKFESRHHDTLLEVNVVRRAQRKSQRPIYGERTRRSDLHCYLAQQADRNGGYTRLLDHILNQPDGLMAERSNRCQQNAIDGILRQPARNLRGRTAYQSRGSRDRAHEAVVAQRHPPDTTLGLQFPQSIER